MLNPYLWWRLNEGLYERLSLYIWLTHDRRQSSNKWSYLPTLKDVLPVSLEEFFSDKGSFLFSWNTLQHLLRIWSILVLLWRIPLTLVFHASRAKWKSQNRRFLHKAQYIGIEIPLSSLFLIDFLKMEFDLESLTPKRSADSPTTSSTSSTSATRAMSTPINLFGASSPLPIRVFGSKPSTPARPEAFPILRLPDCVLHIVFGFLTYDQVAQLRVVCRTLDQVCIVVNVICLEL